jgi:multiple sugar transport system substrate-binding protein
MDGERTGISRREVLKRGLLGAAGLAALPVLVAACGSGSTAPTSTPAPSPTPTPAPSPTPTATPTPTPPLAGELRVGTQYSNQIDIQGFKDIDAAFTAAYPGVNAILDVVDHGTYANTVSYYFQFEPADVATWSSGFRMRQFGSSGVFSPIDEVWAQVKDNYGKAFARSVTGDDGHAYGIPINFYPWAFFYRKSVWAAKGYTVPATWDEFLALCARMRKDGLTPIAMADKDGWPAMATLDYLDLRLNGYDFHVDLLAGRQKWTDARVTTVFERWREIAAFYPQNIANLTWQQATASLTGRKAGMYLMGTFLTGQVDFADPSGATRADLDFFAFPSFGNEFDAEKAVEAPVDILAMCARSATLAANRANAEAYLRFWARGSTQMILYKADPPLLPPASDVDTSALSAWDRKAVEFVRDAGRLTQFFDRDTRPDFAGANAMQTFLLDFLRNPSGDVAALQARIQAFWDALPPYTG